MSKKFIKRITIPLTVIIMVFMSLPMNVFGEGTLGSDLVTYDDIKESNIEFDELSTEEL